MYFFRNCLLATIEEFACEYKPIILNTHQLTIRLRRAVISLAKSYLEKT